MYTRSASVSAPSINRNVWRSHASAERDSAKDQAVVVIFITATVSLLVYAAARPYVNRWQEVSLVWPCPGDLSADNRRNAEGEGEEVVHSCSYPGRSMSDREKKWRPVFYIPNQIHSCSEVLRTLHTRDAPLCYIPSQFGRYNMIQWKLESKRPAFRGKGFRLRPQLIVQ